MALKPRLTARRAAHGASGGTGPLAARLQTVRDLRNAADSSPGSEPEACAQLCIAKPVQNVLPIGVRLLCRAGQPVAGFQRAPQRGDLIGGGQQADGGDAFQCSDALLRFNAASDNSIRNMPDRTSVGSVVGRRTQAKHCTPSDLTGASASRCARVATPLTPEDDVYSRRS